MINGDRVELQNANYNGSTGYFTFDTVADHSVLLKVTDPEGITSQITKKVRINSILAVDFGIYPRVAQRQTAVRFVANSPEAVIYQWDFGDGDIEGGRSNQITHRYEKS
ncbi:MAG: PKD domain-containing protein [Patescibacteria group bacterium]